MRSSPKARIQLATALVLALALPGCLAPHMVLEWAAPAKTLDPTSPEGWHEGNWFAYQAFFPSRNRSIDVALVIFEEREGEYVLGSNSTHGFFGLPFAGNVTKPNLNPVISGEEWPLFRFPLEAGKSWDYELFGYPVTSRVQETRIRDSAGMEDHGGFLIQARSYGKVVAEYTYSPQAQWFTSMAVFDPMNGNTLVTVKLTDYGVAFAQEYYVNVPVGIAEITYPAVRGNPVFSVDGAYESLTAILKLEARAGAFSARLVDPSGRTRMDEQVVGPRAFVTRTTFDAVAGSYELEQLGLGEGRIRLEVYGIAVAQPGQGAPAHRHVEEDGESFAWSWGDGETRRDQRMVAELPHVGHLTSTGSPA